MEGSVSLGVDETTTTTTTTDQKLLAVEFDPKEEPSSCSGLEFTTVASPRSGHRNGYGLAIQSPRLGKSSRPEVVSPSDKFRRRLAKKEIIRRALMPPVKRPTLRWLDFRPTPSRLCNMSIV